MRRARAILLLLEQESEHDDRGEGDGQAPKWLVGELKACQFRRPEEATGYCWHLVHVFASFALEISHSRPAPEFQAGRVPFPGGDWTPKPGARVQHP
jgi:hypothetical protein